MSFTRREMDVAILVAQMHSTQQISDTLCITVDTVYDYLVSVYDKMRGYYQTEDVNRPIATTLLRDAGLHYFSLLENAPTSRH